MHEHLKHHEDKKVYPCMVCFKEFSSNLACKIHFTGKHGDGYICQNCSTHLDSPIQRCRHTKKCLGGGNAIAHPPRDME